MIEENGLYQKGKIHQDELKHSSAVSRVKDETGVEASILETAGNTMYQFFSRSRQQEVCNAITWYIMQTDSNNYVLKDEFTDGGFYKVKEAINMLTHSQEKSLVDISYKKYKELRYINKEERRFPFFFYILRYYKIYMMWIT